MVDKEDKKDEQKFEFDAAGEVIGYISLDQARVLAMRTAREAPGEYGNRYSRVLMAFEVMGEEETEDHYVITLTFRPQGEFVGTPGQEQFFIEKEGSVAHRQATRGKAHQNYSGGGGVGYLSRGSGSGSRLGQRGWW